MSRTNPLLKAPPYPVQQALERLGKNLRQARLRRNLSTQDAAARIGTNRRVVEDAEKGKPSTAIAIYLALLWAYDLLGQMEEVADPLKDREGLTLARARERTQARGAEALDNDF
ncbi:MAG: XRE family transcriptional regulator [Rhizobiales bacterium]|nr:XRE family transcriptional regulator [Hyphomicrobiales bacterium]